MIKEGVDVAIVGGGISGVSLAYELAKRGLEVAVFEKSFLGAGSTGRCGGGIRQQFSTEENIRLAMESVKIFERMEEELGWDIEYYQGGYLILAHTEEEVRQFEKNVRLQRSLGLNVQWLERDEINDIVPELDVDSIGALSATYCPTDGHAYPLKAVWAYAENARRLGAHIYEFTEVKKIIIENDKVLGVVTQRGETRSKYVINAAGAWSPYVAKMAGIELPNKPYRHEILITEPLSHFLDPMVISFHDNVYFRQTKRGGIIGGWGDPEEKPGYNFSSSLRFVTKMAGLLRKYIPSLKHIRILRQWAGLYDVTPDAKPILGPVKGIEGFLQMNGYSGHGFMVAPMCAVLLAQYISGEPLSMSLEPFSIDRFKEGVVGEVSVVG
ncbi:MAG TPA: FAD-binding oxidoreductase [Candidatus Korarchaeota archaeon]|nr:FAD-binding oxidoreductase [Candidatus Korarchaeota archaeon]